MVNAWGGEEVHILEERIRELEKKVEDLRIGRRILMNIVEIVERRKEQEIKELTLRNKKLKQQNSKYAKLILESYQRINEYDISGPKTDCPS